MQFSRKEQWRIFLTVNLILLVGILLFPVYWRYVPGKPFSRCAMLDYLRLYCPACGGTRALGALLHFDVWGSIQYNPIVLIGAVWLVAYEAGMLKYLVKKRDRDLLVKPWMVYVTLGIWLVYTVLRNVLLMRGIDLVGDVIALP